MSELSKDEILKFAEDHKLRRALVVTALALEMRAVRAHILDLGSVFGTGTVYECGEFKGILNNWLVVVAESGAGTHDAQNTVSYAHRDFGNFDAVLFVGIAASRKKDVPIGSVVASTYIYYPYSGKYNENQTYSARPHPKEADQDLIALARKVERDGEWPGRVKPPRLSVLPDEAHYPQPFPPTAVVGPIASIEAVSADPKSNLEELISNGYGDAIAIEMEGYGAAHAAYRERTPFIVIRGISDMRLGKTPEEDAIYQPVAAAHAAAFSFEMLDMWDKLQRRGVVPLQAKALPVESRTASAPVDGKDDSAGPKSVIVLSFSGSRDDFPPEKINAIVVLLRKITGNTELNVVGAEDDSFRLLILCRLEDRAKIDVPDTYKALQRNFSVKLNSVLTRDELRAVAAYQEQLTRASRELLAWPKDLPDGTHLERPELNQILSLIEENEYSTTALLGLPGSGKSALLAALGQELVDRGIPFLAIKADLLDTTIHTERDLTDSLHLPLLVSSLLLQISQLEPVILLIDQLDALAGYVDLSTNRLSALLNLVRKLGERKNIHIVLSARTFEFEHDVRLKAVRADSITLAVPPWSAVLQVLENHGIQAAGWPLDAQEVMRTPQALATFLKLKDRANEPPFSKYQAVLEQLWKERILARPDGTSLARLAGKIAEIMAEKETLWLAAARFEEEYNQIQALIGAGILKDCDDTGGRIGFSHQTVFEHALARAFAYDEGRLSTYVLERQSSLFIRPKLWTSLTYLREVEETTYNHELKRIWSTSDLRLHLRHLLIEFLGQHSAPTATEAAIFEEALQSENRRTALQSIAGSEGWFSLFGQSEVAKAMTDEGEAGIAGYIFSKAWAFAPDTVTSLIERYWIPDAKFDGQTWNVLQEAPTWNNRIAQIAKTILGRTKISSYVFEHLVSTLGADQPEMALELISANLCNQLAAANQKAEELASRPPPKDGEDHRVLYHSPDTPLTDLADQSEGWETLEALAKSHPALFLAKLWPWFKQLLSAVRNRLQYPAQLGFSIPYQLDLKLPEERILDLPQPPILGALARAVQQLAEDDPSGFIKWFEENKNEDAVPAQRMFANAFANQPEKYAQQAAEFLLADDRRFHLGSIHDSASTTKKLIALVSPLWTDETLAEFEEQVLSYAPAPSKDLDARGRQSFNDFIRRLKLDFLSRLPSDRTSPAVKKYVAEEERRFPLDRRPAPPEGAKFIGSPISLQNLLRASDDDILNAFIKLPDAAAWDHPKRWMEGGNIQLSREFATFAKENQERAGRIIKRFEPAFGSRAAAHALEAMADTAEPSLILGLIDHLDQRGFTSEEFRGMAANAIHKLLNRDVEISEKTLSMLLDWLLTADAVIEVNSVSDSEEESESEDSKSGDGKSSEKTSGRGSILWGLGGITVIPQGNFQILEVVTRVLLGRRQYSDLIGIYKKRLGLNENFKIWLALLRYFRFIRPENTEELEGFLTELFDRYPELPRSSEGIMMLAYLQWQVPELVHKTLLGWKGTGNDRLQQAYGELVALIALSQPNLSWAKEFLSEILKSSDMPDGRTGAAYAAVNLWNEQKLRHAAATVLTDIIPKAEGRTWSAIFDLFRLTDEITPEDDWIAVLKAIASHIDRAKKANSTFVIERLQTLLPHQARLIALIAQGFVANWKSELGDLRTARAMDARELVDLAITLHRLGPETRDMGTSLFEDLLVVNAYTARETLDELDNKFRPTARQPRRRLPRRVNRPSRT